MLLDLMVVGLKQLLIIKDEIICLFLFLLTQSTFRVSPCLPAMKLGCAAREIIRIISTLSSLLGCSRRQNEV